MVSATFGNTHMLRAADQVAVSRSFSARKGKASTWCNWPIPRFVGASSLSIKVAARNGQKKETANSNQDSQRPYTKGIITLPKLYTYNTHPIIQAHSSLIQNGAPKGISSAQLSLYMTLQHPSFLNSLARPFFANCSIPSLPLLLLFCCWFWFWCCPPCCCCWPPP